MALTIRRAIEQVLAGTIRIPGFQRGYVWEPTRAALLMDSLHKGYPVGSLLLWRTRSRLKSERRLGVFELPDADPDYPLDYVLDGQQRLTSIFSTFQTDLEPSEANPGVWLPIYYDFASTADAQESAFVALASEDADPERYFPLATFLDPVEFSRHARDLPDDRNAEIAQVQQRFLETLVPVQTFETEERTTVAIVFERVNRMGVELDVFQLLTAWTWSDEFDLQKEFLDLADEFSDFGFGDLGTDSELMLRCTAAALRSDPSPSSLVDMTGGEVRGQFDDVAEAMRRAIDFVKTNFFIRHLGLLPYSALLVPLTAFFFERPAAPVSDEQHRELVKWFWRSSFSHRYSGNPQRNIRRDIAEAVKLREGVASDLAIIPLTLEPKFFIDNRFGIRTVATKAFVLLLAQQQPRTFMSGERVNLERVLSETNRSEYHHCFPRSVLEARGEPLERINALANYAIISRLENRTISGREPSAYRPDMPDDATLILQSALVPESLFEDDYEVFVTERAAMLAAAAQALV